MKLIRIVARWTKAIDPIDNRMTFDILVDDRDVAHFRFMTFGAVGQLNDNPSVFYPFSLNREGEMTYSSEDEGPESTHKINIFGRTAVVGEYFTFSEEGQESTYQIIEAINLSEAIG